jgi:glycosyltransferase involved in cell wall biosynthesis
MAQLRAPSGQHPRRLPPVDERSRESERRWTSSARRVRVNPYMGAEVLLVSPTSAPGGAERGLLALARNLHQFGYEPHTVLLQHGGVEEWLAEGDIEAEVLPLSRTRHLHRTLPVVWQLRRRATSAVAVIANHSKGHAVVGTAAAMAHTPCIWWQHGVATGHSLIEQVAAVVPSAAVVCYTEEARAAQRRLTPHRRVEVIPGGIDLTRVRAGAGGGEQLRERYGWNGPVVGIVARLEPWKGQELFLRAAARVTRDHPDAHFAVVGGAILGWEGDYPERLRCLAADLGIGDRVVFAGHQPDVWPWFDALDVAVTASTGEPFGLVTVEAMSLGKPVVGVSSGGTEEIIEDGVSGILVPPGDPAALASAVSSILSDPPLHEKLSSGALRRAEVFSDTAMVSRFAALLDEVTHRR